VRTTGATYRTTGGPPTGTRSIKSDEEFHFGTLLKQIIFALKLREKMLGSKSMF